MNFHVGERCSLRDLLYASMMQSDNQAAQALSEHVGRALAADDIEPGMELRPELRAKVGGAVVRAEEMAPRSRLAAPLPRAHAPMALNAAR